MGGVSARPGQFSLFKRGRVWYYYTYNQSNVRCKFSTGMKSRAEAFDECLKRKEQGNLVPKHNKKVKSVKTITTLSSFGKNFWDYDTCPIIQGKIKRGGHYSVKLAKANGANFHAHVEPYLGDMDIKSITSADIEEWLLNLPESDNVSNKTANNCFFTLRQMLDYAVFSQYIPLNPAVAVKPLVKDSVRHSAFSPEQIQELFSTHWENDWAYLACYTASRTGMRIGEIRALTKEQLFPDHIVVNASWSNEEGRKCTKSGYERIVPITEDLYNLLIKKAPPFGGLLFSLDGEKPVRDQYITNRLKDRMDEINKEKGTLFFDYNNKAKPLTFHSFRHFMNTRLLAANIPESKIRAIIGHESSEMTEHYAHLNANDFSEIREIQERMNKNQKTTFLLS